MRGDAQTVCAPSLKRGRAARMCAGCVPPKHGSVRIRANLEPEAGFEPAAFALQERCSGRLSYSGGPGREDTADFRRGVVPAKRTGVVAPVSSICDPDARPAPRQTVTQTSVLSRRDADVLDFEREWWRYAGAKEEAIAARFELGVEAYYALLNDLIDTDGAVDHDPMLVKRLRRLRAQRQRERAARRVAAEAR